MNVTNIIGLVLKKNNTRYSPVSGCIYLIGQHIHLISKDLTSDNLFDILSRTINQETKKNDLIRKFNILQGIPLFQAVAASYANNF